MKKISTLFKKDPNNLARVTEEVDLQNQWVMDGEGVATRKWDGTACAIINGALYKRYDVKKGKQVPNGAIPCQEPDKTTGHWPHWVRCLRSDPQDKYHIEAFDVLSDDRDGTYELIGPKVNGNRERKSSHVLMRHGNIEYPMKLRGFWLLKGFLEAHDIEGLVFHHPDGRMCKIRAKDFGIQR